MNITKIIKNSTLKKRIKPLLIIAALGVVGYSVAETIYFSNVNLQETVLSPSTNPTIERMRQAMISFRNSLPKDLLRKSSNSLNSKRFLKWHNTPVPSFGGWSRNRHGIFYGDLSQEQLDKFTAVLKLFLSKDGYQKVDEITILAEGFLHQKQADFWDSDFYSIDMFGNPAADGSWGFQLDGHHCAINFLVHGDNVSMVPAFLGAQPVKEVFNGQAFDIFKDERDLALQLYSNLSEKERSAAESTSKEGRGLRLGPARSPRALDPYRGNYDYSGFKKGLKYTDLSAKSAQNIQLLMQEFVHNLSSTFADKWWQDITTNMDETYFVWIDSVDEPSATTQFYYRIYNPYLWVEFNVQSPNHVHSITRIPNNPRTKNGGDYGIFAHLINQNGKGTLYEHYASADHHQDHKCLFDYEIEGTASHGHLHHH